MWKLKNKLTYNQTVILDQPVLSAENFYSKCFGVPV